MGRKPSVRNYEKLYAREVYKSQVEFTKIAHSFEQALFEGAEFEDTFQKHNKRWIAFCRRYNNDLGEYRRGKNVIVTKLDTRLFYKYAKDKNSRDFDDVMDMDIFEITKPPHFLKPFRFLLGNEDSQKRNRQVAPL